MVDTNNIIFAMNEMGQFFLQTADGSQLPTILADQKFTSERDARIGLTRFIAKYEAAKKEAKKCQEQTPNE